MMGNRDDAEFFARNLIDDAIGEPSKKVAVSGAAENCSELWVGQNDINRSLELRHKRAPKLDIRARRVECRSVAQFRKRGRNDDQLHFNVARTCARASAIGMT